MTKLDIFSDPVCPWCFVGKSMLDRALAEHPEAPFSLEWHPFQLNPDMARDGVNKRDYLMARFGDPGRLRAAHERLQAMADEAGVAFDPDLPERIPNTLDAHRMIHWAGLEGLQGPVVTALFRGYWQEGRNIGSKVVLADLGEEAGLDHRMVERLLAGDADLAAIRARDNHARSRGVMAVPTFIVAGQYALQGAQSPEVWAKVIAEIGQHASAGS